MREWAYETTDGHWDNVYAVDEQTARRMVGARIDSKRPVTLYRVIRNPIPSPAAGD